MRAVVVDRLGIEPEALRVQEIDPHAFVVISSPSEVQGGYPMAWRK